MEKDNKNNNGEKSSFIKIKEEDQRMLLVAVIMIAFLIFMSYDRISNINSSVIEKNGETDPHPIINIPSLEDITSPDYLDEIMKEMKLEEDITEISYTSHVVENSLRFAYPSSWSLMDVERKNVNNIKGADVIFMAYSRNINNQGNILIFKIEAKNVEEVMQKLKEMAENEEEELEINQVDDFILEIERKTSEKIVPFSWQKVVFTQEECYLLSLNFSIENKEYFRKIKDMVFPSVKVIEK